MIIAGLIGMFDSIFRIGVTKDEASKPGFSVSKIREVKLDKMYDEIVKESEKEEKM